MSNRENFPSVTIAIPTYNEEEHIEQVIHGFLDMDYPNLLEILIADGGSEDNTREIITSIAKNDSRVVMIDNPDKYQSYALNKMIEIAKGEVFIRADAHCEYGDSYISRCIESLHRFEVKNVGGALRFLAQNLVQAGTAVAVLSLIGNGGAKHYNPYYEGYSDTVPMGCFWTKDLIALQGYRESNHTNEDAEINYRIIEHLNGKIYIDPKIELWYYPRANFSGLFKQYFNYGRGRLLTSIAHEGKIPFRSKAPFVFFCVMIPYFIIDQLFFDRILGSIYILSAILFVTIADSMRISLKHRNYFKEKVWRNSNKTIPKPFSISLFALLALIIMHLSHFMGYSFQLIKARIFKLNGW